MAIFEVNEENIGKLLLPGMMASIRQGLKSKIMEQLEKDVDVVLDATFNTLAGTINSYRNFEKDQVVFQFNVNGVPFK